MARSKLLLKTFDGTMKKCILNPKCTESRFEMFIQYYEEEDILKDAELVFEQVISVDFEVNYFDNFIGAELFGFYEIFDKNKKQGMINKIFQNRIEEFLNHGDYDYDPNDPHDMLNYKKPIDEIVKQLDEYHLYQQQTQGGVFCILAKCYHIITKTE